MTDSAKPSRAQKIVLWSMAIFLAAMFFFSMVLRMSNPQLRVENARDQQQGMQGQMGGENMAAIGNLMNQMKESPDDPALLMELGHRLMGMGDYTNAEVFLLRAQALHPTNSTLIQMMGVNLFNMERFQEAAEQFETILAMDPGNANARFNLGILYNHYLNQPEKAKQILNDLLNEKDLDPEMRSRIEEELQAGMHEANAPQGE